jgi:hypothetical protein
VTAPAFRPDPETFDKLYRGEPVVEGGPAPAGVPWDVHQAQPRLMELEALGGFSGEVLDIGCGLGDNAIYLAWTLGDRAGRLACRDRGGASTRGGCRRS